MPILAKHLKRIYVSFLSHLVIYKNLQESLGGPQAESTGHLGDEVEEAHSWTDGLWAHDM